MRDNGDIVKFLERNNSDSFIHADTWMGCAHSPQVYQVALITLNCPPTWNFLSCFIYLLSDFLYACLNVCTCSLRGQWKVSDPLELEWQVLLGSHASAGDRTHVLWKSNKYSYPLNHLSRPSRIQFWSNSIPMLLSNGLFNSTEPTMPFHQHKYFHCSQLGESLNSQA